MDPIAPEVLVAIGPHTALVLLEWGHQLGGDRIANSSSEALRRVADLVGPEATVTKRERGR